MRRPAARRPDGAAGTGTLRTDAATIPGVNFEPFSDYFDETRVTPSPHWLARYSRDSLGSLPRRVLGSSTTVLALGEEVDLDVVHGAPKDLPTGDLIALNNSFGFGGHDIAIAFRSA